MCDRSVLRDYEPHFSQHAPGISLRIAGFWANGSIILWPSFTDPQHVSYEPRRNHVRNHLGIG